MYVNVVPVDFIYKSCFLIWSLENGKNFGKKQQYFEYLLSHSQTPPEQQGGDLLDTVMRSVVPQ
jgi:hypothetical protein